MTSLCTRVPRGRCKRCRDGLRASDPECHRIGRIHAEAVVPGWRLPMEHTDIETHEIESSRPITATSFRLTRECDRPLITREVHATPVVGGTKA